MEEADLDELEWMACQQLPPEEEEDYYLDEEPPPEVDADISRKRLWGNEDSAIVESSGNAESGAAKKLRGPQLDPPVNARKRLVLSIPGMGLDVSSEKPGSPPTVVSEDSQYFHRQRQSVTSVSKDKPKSPPPPAPTVEEAHPMSPPRDQEGESMDEAEPFTVINKFPYRLAADIDGDYISITGVNGDRVYAARAEPLKTSCNASAGTVRSKGLLGEPIANMIERLERETFEQVIAESDKKIRAEGVMEETETVTEHEDLWVDKYAPRSFTELLSDEQTNREVLRWLKHWDQFVFGGKKRSTSEEVLTSLRRQLTQTHGNGYRGARESRNKYMNRNMPLRSDNLNNDSARKVTTEPSTLDRPDEKVLLLCGPPGLGKTTLAHVAARHCGYRVVEINASDDRVATTLQGKILDAIQMQSVVGDNRPNCLFPRLFKSVQYPRQFDLLSALCLISLPANTEGKNEGRNFVTVIDEIDGALSGAEGKGAIDALLEIINAEKKSSPDKENDGDEGFTRKNSRKKGGPAVRRLSRPVICICNDLYAPALRNLRQVARVHVFVQPSVSRVVSRLKYICGKEKYITNARALSALASHTECDIRSCLNTLQFLNRKKQNLKTLDVGSQVIGRKDMTSSMFDIWAEIFHKRKTRQGTAMRGMVEIPESGNQDHKDFVRRYGLFSNHGDFDHIMNGIHENILQMRYLDASLHKTVEALEWMGDSEIFSHLITSKQQFHLLAYQPMTMIAIRGLVAQQERPQVNWPKAYQKCRTENAVKKEMLCSWLAAMTSSISRSLSPSCLSLDIITPLLSILTPPTIRPVASQLLTAKEKDEVTELVDTMLGFGISYKHPKPGLLKAEYGMEGLSVLALFPPIDTLVKYKDYTTDYRQLSSTLCQLLAHEVDIERIRREGAIRESKVGDVNPKTKAGEDVFMKRDEQSNAPLKLFDGHSKVETGRDYKKCDSPLPKEIVLLQQEKTEPHQPTNFFDRFKKSTQTGVTADVKAKERLATLQRDSRPLLYKFHEGFTNAVKRPMLVRDFL